MSPVQQNPPRPKLKGWRYAAFIGAFVGILGAAIYPAIIAPLRNPQKWQKISEENRKIMHLKQEDIQPGNMKVWTDPFDRPGKPGNK